MPQRPESPAPKAEPKGLLASVGRWLRTFAILLAFAYPALLLLAWLTIRYLGEHWWLTTLALYLPRAGFLLPLPISLLLVLAFRMWRLLWLEGLSLLLVLFPLMGLELPSVDFSSEGPTVTVLSFNVDSSNAGVESVAKRILESHPDIAFIQEANLSAKELAKALKPRLPHTHAATYTMIASRFPLVETTAEARLPYYGRLRSPRFQRYLVKTPLGPIALYNIHPLSPRGSLNLYRFRGAFSKLRRGELLNEQSKDALEDNAGLRRLQVEAIGRLAAAEIHPVIIAGDFNLPGLSRLFADNLGNFRDGFREAGVGFGYTFPAKYPWMRLDRILTSSDLDFASFQVDCKGLSDHLCVTAEIRADD